MSLGEKIILGLLAVVLGVQLGLLLRPPQAAVLEPFVQALGQERARALILQAQLQDALRRVQELERAQGGRK